MKRIPLISFVSVLLAASPALAENTVWNVGGRVQSVTTGDIVNGNVDMTFTLYSSNAPDATPLWSGQATVNLDEGRFSVALGADTAEVLDALDVAGFDELFLGIQVNNNDEASPRLRVGSVPDADTVGGVGAGDFVQGTQLGADFSYDATSNNWSVVGGNTTESDPVYTASPAAGINAGNITDWDMALSWGDHADAGYLSTFAESEPTFLSSDAAAVTDAKIANWDAAHGWGDHGSAG